MSSNPKASKKKGGGRKSNATKLAHKKFRWFEQLAADPDMPLLALRACILIGSKCTPPRLRRWGQVRRRRRGRGLDRIIIINQMWSGEFGAGATWHDGGSCWTRAARMPPNRFQGKPAAAAASKESRRQMSLSAAMRARK